MCKLFFLHCFILYIAQWQDWRNVILQHLGHQGIKLCYKFCNDLLCVDSGMKPSLLLDFVVKHTNSSSVVIVRDMLSMLKQHRLLRNDLIVLSLQDDIIIINPVSVRSFFGQDSYLSTLIFVDVSGHLEGPKIIPCSESYLRKTTECFKKILIDASSQPVGNFLEITIVMPCHDDCGAGTDMTTVNPSTLYGLLLGYPVVYYYSLPPWTGTSNCLSMELLAHFTVNGTLDNTTDRTHDVGHRNGHSVYSFSVPEVHLASAEASICGWFDRMARDGVFRDMFTGISMKRTQVRLPCVCL